MPLCDRWSIARDGVGRWRDFTVACVTRTAAGGQIVTGADGVESDSPDRGGIDQTAGVRRVGAGTGPARTKRRAACRSCSRPQRIGLAPAVVMRRVLILAGLGTVALILGLVVLIGAAANNSSADCGAAGSGPSSVAGIPGNLLPIFESAARQFNLGSSGWAYLAAYNDAESTFDTSTLPGVHSGANYAGAAGPMQIGISGTATDNWVTVVGEIPSKLSGGTTPPSVYDEADAVYGGAALLSRWGAPAHWAQAERSWNNYAPEISEVNNLVAGYVNGSSGASTSATTSATATTTSSSANGGGGAACTTISGPSVPGASSAVESDGLAAIASGAPQQVQAMLSAGNELINYPYSYGGGHCAPAMAVPPGPGDCVGDEANGGAGYDCSSAVSFVLWGGGLGQSLLGGSPEDSDALQSVGDPGPGKWVTVYAGTSGTEGHAFVVVDGVVMDTVHGQPTTPSGTGPRWQPLAELQFELSTGSFVARHPPGL
jgi:hypothetical protein